MFLDGSGAFDFESDGGDAIIGECRFYYRSKPYSNPRKNFVKVVYDEG